MCRAVVDWRLVGVFATEDEVRQRVRKMTCSRRKVDELQTGTKVTYRCNSWKRTRCSYQMYSLFTPERKFFLYEGNQHDHTGVRVPNAPVPASQIVDMDFGRLLDHSQGIHMPGPSTIGSHIQLPQPSIHVQETAKGFNAIDFLSSSSEKIQDLCNFSTKANGQPNNNLDHTTTALPQTDMNLYKKNDELQEVDILT